jgi:restriction endonuclease
MLTPERWQKVRDLLEQALELANNPNAAEGSAARAKAAELAKQHGVVLRDEDYDRLVAAWIERIKNRKRRRSKDSTKAKLDEVFAEIFRENLHIMTGYANLAWQRQKIREFMHTKASNPSWRVLPGFSRTS